MIFCGKDKKCGGIGKMMVQWNFMMVPMKQQIARRAQVCHISDQVQSSLETAWEQCNEKPQDLPLYKLRDNSGKLVYSKLNEAGPPVGETDDSEESESMSSNKVQVINFIIQVWQPEQKFKKE